jgi:hypothetical protein
MPEILLLLKGQRLLLKVGVLLGQLNDLRNPPVCRAAAAAQHQDIGDTN